MSMLVLIYKFVMYGMQRPKVSKNNHFISHILKGTIYNSLPLQEKKSFFISSSVLLFKSFLHSNSVAYCKLSAALQ